jgi:CRISPR-associated protein Cas1
MTATDTVDVAASWRSVEPPPRPESLPAARFLHVVQQGAQLHRVGERLRVTHDGLVLRDIRTDGLEGVVVYGAVQVTTQALGLLVDRGVWLSLHTRTGRFRGRVVPPEPRLHRLRRAHWQRATDEPWVNAFSRNCVRGKVLGMLATVEALARNRPGIDVASCRALLRAALTRAAVARSRDELRGIEGAASRAYFETLRALNADLELGPRARRPARDPVNALLNLGYTFITNELAGLLEACGLDATLGFYHEDDPGRPSLACDWVEEFRHPCIDRLVLTLLNKRMIGATDFEPLDERRGLRLRPDGLRTFIAAYEQVLGGPSTGTRSRRPGYRHIILRQLARLVDAIAVGAPYTAHTDTQA